MFYGGQAPSGVKRSGHDTRVLCAGCGTDTGVVVPIGFAVTRKALSTRSVTYTCPSCRRSGSTPIGPE